MTPRKQKNLRMVVAPEPLRVAHPHAAGIDVHAREHWVAVPPDQAPPPPADHSPNTSMTPNVKSAHPGILENN